MIIILGLAAAYSTLRYLEYRDKKTLEKLKESKPSEIQEELTEEQFLDSLANPEYKYREITVQDIKGLESLKSEPKPISEEERIKELEYLESLKAK